MPKKSYDFGAGYSATISSSIMRERHVAEKKKSSSVKCHLHRFNVPSPCSGPFGSPYTETNRFVKVIFDNALRTFPASDIYRRRGQDTSLEYLCNHREIIWKRILPCNNCTPTAFEISREHKHPFNSQSKTWRGYHSQ